MPKTQPAGYGANDTQCIAHNTVGYVLKYIDTTIVVLGDIR